MQPEKTKESLIATRLVRWHQQGQRSKLPWRIRRDPYSVWISEVMLQQTQVKTVIAYFERFMKRFKDIESLAKASTEQVLEHWAGLGYYQRAINLHKTARIILEKGNWPQNKDQWQALPGIGRSTAAAISALSMNQPEAILDGNARRVLARFYAVGLQGSQSRWHLALWELAEKSVSRHDPCAYTEAIMDLGAMVCTPQRPDCNRCCLKTDCKAFKLGQMERFSSYKKSKQERVRKVWRLGLIRSKDMGIFLMKRPEKGIWAGLWCPPIICENAEADWCGTHLSCQIASIEPRPVHMHRFTHLDVELRPLVIELKSEPKGLDESRRLFSLKQAELLAMATPIKHIVVSSFMR